MFFVVDVLLFFFLQQADFDMLLVNLRMDATYIKEGMNISWVSEVIKNNQLIFFHRLY